MGEAKQAEHGGAKAARRKAGSLRLRLKNGMLERVEVVTFGVSFPNEPVHRLSWIPSSLTEPRSHLAAALGKPRRQVAVTTDEYIHTTTSHCLSLMALMGTHNSTTRRGGVGT